MQTHSVIQAFDGPLMSAPNEIIFKKVFVTIPTTSLTKMLSCGRSLEHRYYGINIVFYERDH